MNETAKIELASATVKPFEALEGVVRWLRSERPPALELRVFWMTRGRGTEEVSVEAVSPVSLGADGSVAFSIPLPGLPWSFDGQLISLSWAVELVDDQGEGCAMEEFVLSPDGVVRKLGAIDKPESEGKFVCPAPESRLAGATAAEGGSKACEGFVRKDFGGMAADIRG